MELGIRVGLPVDKRVSTLVAEVTPQLDLVSAVQTSPVAEVPAVKQKGEE
jgi:hypothetical protein